MIHGRFLLKGVDHGGGDIYKLPNIAMLEFPQNPQNPGTYADCGAIVSEILGVLGKFEPGGAFALPASQILGKFEPGDVLATEDAKTLPGSNFPRFLKPEMQK